MSLDGLDESDQMKMNNDSRKRKSTRIFSKDQDLVKQHTETDSQVKDCEVRVEPCMEKLALSCNAKLLPGLGSKSLSVAEVLEHLRKLSSNEDNSAFHWIKSNIKTKSTNFSKRFVKQFNGIRELGLYIDTLSPESQEQWSNTLNNSKYTTPRLLSGWQLVFGGSLPLICKQNMNVNLSFLNESKITKPRAKRVRKKRRTQPIETVHAHSQTEVQSAEIVRFVYSSTTSANKKKRVCECNTKYHYREALKQLKIWQDRSRYLEHQLMDKQRMIVKRNIQINQLRKNKDILVVKENMIPSSSRTETLSTPQENNQVNEQEGRNLNLDNPPTSVVCVETKSLNIIECGELVSKSLLTNENSTDGKDHARTSFALVKSISFEGSANEVGTSGVGLSNAMVPADVTPLPEEIKTLDTSLSVISSEGIPNEQEKKLAKNSSRQRQNSLDHPISVLKIQLKQVSSELSSRSFKSNLEVEIQALKKCVEQVELIEININESEYKINLYKREIIALQTDLMNSEMVLKNQLNQNEFIANKYNDLRKFISSKVNTKKVSSPKPQQPTKEIQSSMDCKVESPSEHENNPAPQQASKFETSQELPGTDSNTQKSSDENDNNVSAQQNTDRIVLTPTRADVENVACQSKEQDALICGLESDIKLLRDSVRKVTVELCKEKTMKTDAEAQCKNYQFKLKDLRYQLSESHKGKAKEISALKTLNYEIRKVKDENYAQLKAKESECEKLRLTLGSCLEFVSDVKSALGLSPLTMEPFDSCDIPKTIIYREEVNQIKLWYHGMNTKLERNKKIIHCFANQMTRFKLQKKRYANINKQLKKNLLTLKNNMATLRTEIDGVKAMCPPSEKSTLLESQRTLREQQCRCRYLQQDNTDLTKELLQEKKLNETLGLKCEQWEMKSQRLSYLLKQEHAEASRQLELQLAMFCSTSERYREQVKRIEDAMDEG